MEGLYRGDHHDAIRAIHVRRTFVFAGKCVLIVLCLFISALIFTFVLSRAL